MIIATRRGASAAPNRSSPLALPDKLIDLRSDQGEAMLLETKPLDGYLPISARNG